MDCDTSYWHTPTAHYAVVPLPAIGDALRTWALRCYRHAGTDTIITGTRASCCDCLAIIRAGEERKIAS